MLNALFLAPLWAAFALASETAGQPPAAKDTEKVVLEERTQDLRTLIVKAVAAGEKKVVIPPGRYRARPEGETHLLFERLSDVEIIADDVEMVCTTTAQAIGFQQCSNLTLRGLTVDYNPLPFTQGRIVALGENKRWVEFELVNGYPENELEERIEVFDPVTGELRRASYYGWGAFERTGPRRYRVSKGEDYRYRSEVDTEQVGDFLVTNNRFPAGTSGHAVVLTACSNVIIEKVTLYASPVFGFLENDCFATTFLRCKIDRRDIVDDPVKRSQPRLRSLNADAFHSRNAIKGPAILSCTAHFQGDDCVNIHGQYYYVAGSNGKTLRMLSVGKPNIVAGDPVEFLPYQGPRPLDAVVVNIAPDPVPLTESEKVFIRRLSLQEGVRKRLLERDVRLHRLTLDRGIDLPEGSAVCSAVRLGNGFAVKDCDFGHNRSRGVVIKASNGEVTGNRITKSRMAAVLISPEYFWMESGCSSYVTVKNNILRSIGEVPIQILAPGGNGHPMPAGAHRNISILNNRFQDCPWPLIQVTSTTGLSLEGNFWSAEPPPSDSTSSRNKLSIPVQLINCREVRRNP